MKRLSLLTSSVACMLQAIGLSSDLIVRAQRQTINSKKIGDA